MSKGGEVRIDDRELVKALDELAGDVAAMPETHEAVGDTVLPAIRQRTPTRSGDLASSWTATPEGDRVTISSDLPYARTVEFYDGPVQGGIDASERAILEVYEDQIARQARAIGFEVKR